tara:strand:+ start:70 stop:348 length:279 start_codon:yes stop_codon:yes gene_type:complete
MKKNDKQTILLGIGIIIAGIMMIMGVMISKAEAKTPKSKFYDFSEQLIDGDIKKPTALYTDARTQVKFDRLLSLKKSFLPALLNTSKDPVFK